MNDIFSSLLIPHMCMYQLLLIKAILAPDMWHCHFMLFFLCSMIRGEKVIVYFVDIGGIIDHLCLNFLFIILSCKYDENYKTCRIGWYVTALGHIFLLQANQVLLPSSIDASNTNFIVCGLFVFWSFSTRFISRNI
jgi:hypothetical protein